MLWLLLGSSVALACDPNASTFYIDPVGGNDANACSQEAPCKTATKVQTLLGTAQPGHQILLKRGTTLAVNAPLRMERSGTEGKPITLGAYGDSDAAQPILDAAGMSGGSMLIDCREQGYWMVQDLHFKGNKGAINYASCRHQVFQRNTISSCAQECIHAGRASPTTFSAHITIKGNLINAPNRTEGIYIGTDPEKSEGTFDLTQDVLIDGNEITGGQSHECIEMKQGSQRVTVTNNNIHDNVITQNGCIFSSRKDPDSPEGHHVITDNTIKNLTGSAAYGVRVRNDATIEGNEIRDTAQMGIFLESTAGYPIYKRTLSVKEAGK